MIEGSGHILIVLPGLAAGGSERIVSLLANHWAEAGRKVTIAAFEAGNTPSYYRYRPDVNVRRLGVPAARGGFAGLADVGRRIRTLRTLIAALRPDMVLSFLTRTNVMTLLAAAGLGVPVVVSERNNPRLQRFGPAWTMLRWLLYPRAAALVTMTRGAMAAFAPAAGRRDWVIPNPAELPPRTPAWRDSPRLVAVGRLVPQKGFDLLLDAFSRVAGRHPDWTLEIWGEGPDRAALQAQRDALGLGARVCLPGVSARPGSWLEGGGLFVLSSRFEGWGIVLLEAMAAGFPAVSFDCEWGPGEMIGDGRDGILVPTGEVPAMAAALDRVMADPALRARLGSAAALSTRRFAPETVFAAWDQVAAAALRPVGPASAVRQTGQGQGLQAR